MTDRVPSASATAIPATRNHCMDAVKGLACIAIVFMHCEFPGRLGTLVQCLTWFGVPFFFMVSGYFCHSSKGRPDYGKKIRHVLEIVLWTTLFYALVTPLYAPWEGWPDFKALRNWLLFNKTFYIAGNTTVAYLRPLLCVAVAICAAVVFTAIRNALSVRTSPIPPKGNRP